MAVTSGPAPAERVAPPASRSAVPARADGVELLGELGGSGYRTPPALARRADGQVVQLTRLLYGVLAAVDGRRSIDEIAAVVSAAAERTVTAANVATLIDKQLMPLGLLRRPDGSQPEVQKTNPLLGLRFRFVVSNPQVTRRVTAPFAVLFQPLLVVALVCAFAAVCWWVTFEKGLASATHEALYQPGMLLIVFGLTVLSAGFHEFGHAAAARYGGSTPGAMGMGLYLVWPAFYTDVTDSYRLGRGGRVRTDLGGLYFNAIVAVVMFGLWWGSHWDALLLIIAAQVLQMVRQLAPLVRFDGYHVLADLVGAPDLYRHIKPTLLGLLPHNWHKPEHRVLKPWARTVVTTWVLLVMPLLALTLFVVVVAFPRIAATAWDSLGRQADRFSSAFVQGDVSDMAVRLLSIVAIALPIFGIVYIVTRLVRRIATGAWRRTAGRPVRRAGVTALALAVVAGLLWAWWPEGDRYRPIQPYERGTLADALPLASSDGPGLEAGRITRGRAVWAPGEPLPSADDPKLAVVLVPRQAGEPAVSEATDATTTSTSSPSERTSSLSETESVGDPVSTEEPVWVFPFDRPPAPSEGDNQALAVNTVNGSTLYEVAFALVWAEGETTDNVNSAYALASCVRCQTVAVAFQVVLVLGHSDTIVPQNLAAAVNYACIECVTHALATQLLVTLEGPLSDASMTELTRLWREIAAYGENVEGVPLSEIQARLTEFEAEILAIIERDQGLLDRGAPVTDPTADPTSQSTPDSDSTTGGDTGGDSSGEPSTDSTDDTTAGTSSTGEATGGKERTDETAETEPSPSPTSEPTTTEPSSSPEQDASSSSPSPTPTASPSPTSSP